MKSHRLEIDQVTKSFGRVEVLRGVSLQVEAGTFVTLLGPSGCGKTTLLRIIAGLERADAGHVRLGGHDLLRLPANQRPINTVFQNYALFPHLTVYENIAFGLRARKFERNEIARRVEQGLGLLRIEELAERQPDQLSGGQRQRVALARALVNEPDVLLLDEPMSALDAKLRAEVQLELRRLQRRLGKTFILVTHDQDEALTVSDRILVMRAGQIEQEGPPQEVYEQPVSRFVAEFLGSANLIPAWAENGHFDTPFGPLRPASRPAWQRGMLAIRPERIGLDTMAPAENGIQATVRDVVFRGDHTEVFVDVAAAQADPEANGGATPLRVRCPGSAGLKPGDAVWLNVTASHLHPINE